MSAFELSGNLIAKYETQQVKETFKKREFVIENRRDVNGVTYSDFVKFQLTQTKCDLLDNYQEGEMVKVSFNIRGSKWTKQDGTISYITNLEAWRLEKMSATTSGNSNFQQPVNNMTPITQNAPAEDIVDDLPF